RPVHGKTFGPAPAIGWIPASTPPEPRKPQRQGEIQQESVGGTRHAQFLARKGMADCPGKRTVRQQAHLCMAASVHGSFPPHRPEPSGLSSTARGGYTPRPTCNLAAFATPTCA